MTRKVLLDHCDKLEVGSLYAVDGANIEASTFMVIAEQSCWNLDQIRIYYRVLWDCGELLTWYVDPLRPGRARSADRGLSVYKLLPMPNL